VPSPSVSTPGGWQDSKRFILMVIVAGGADKSQFHLGEMQPFRRGHSQPRLGCCATSDLFVRSHKGLQDPVT
jgi:hypothetical protein